MPRVTCVSHDGHRTTLDVAVGNTVMMAAVFSNVRGIEGACGGFLSCATCHVYVDEAFAARLPPPTAEEKKMLAQAASPRRPTSRLSCQIKLTADHEGLRVRIPDRQQ